MRNSKKKQNEFITIIQWYCVGKNKVPSFCRHKLEKEETNFTYPEVKEPWCGYMASVCWWCMSYKFALPFFYWKWHIWLQSAWHKKLCESNIIGKNESCLVEQLDNAHYTEETTVLIVEFESKNGFIVFNDIFFDIGCEFSKHWYFISHSFHFGIS